MNQTTYYTLNIAARAAGYRCRELRRQSDIGALKLQRCDRASTGSGDHAGYSRRRVLQAAVTKELIGVGITMAKASVAAFVFSDKGQTGRGPGETFELGKTLLVIGKDGSATIKNVFADASVADVSGLESCVCIVNLNQVVDRVDAVLHERK
jgi:hypothetical protein